MKLGCRFLPGVWRHWKAVPDMSESSDELRRRIAPAPPWEAGAVLSRPRSFATS